MTQSEMFGFSVRRADSTHPADPAPTTTTSNSASNPDLVMIVLLQRLRSRERFSGDLFVCAASKSAPSSETTILTAHEYFDRAEPVCKHVTFSAAHVRDGSFATGASEQQVWPCPLCPKSGSNFRALTTCQPTVNSDKELTATPIHTKLLLHCQGSQARGGQAA